MFLCWWGFVLVEEHGLDTSWNESLLLLLLLLSVIYNMHKGVYQVVRDTIIPSRMSPLRCGSENPFTLELEADYNNMNQIIWSSSKVPTPDEGILCSWHSFHAGSVSNNKGKKEAAVVRFVIFTGYHAVHSTQTRNSSTSPNHKFSTQFDLPQQRLSSMLYTQKFLFLQVLFSPSFTSLTS